MAKLKNPLLSLKASGSVGRVITFLRRRGVDLVEKKPEIRDVHTYNQLAWRHMFNKCVDLWHLLSPAEKAEWESAARSRHMTGYAWYISQCLRPNPGIYLPLQGGTMSGDIDMNSNRVLKLPPPLDQWEAANKRYVDASSTPGREGARVYHSVDQAVPRLTEVFLAFNSERWDTDTIHDTVANNSRLTCKTAGKYAIMGNIRWQANVTEMREMYIKLNHTTTIAQNRIVATTCGSAYELVSTIYDLAVGDFVELMVTQDTAVSLNIQYIPNYSPEFMIQGIG